MLMLKAFYHGVVIRLLRMSDASNFKYPIILPKNAVFTSLVVRYSHLLTGHGGIGFTLNHVRQSGFFYYLWCFACQIASF